jgi:hypothetical protein
VTYFVPRTIWQKNVWEKDQYIDKWSSINCKKTCVSTFKFDCVLCDYSVFVTFSLPLATPIIFHKYLLWVHTRYIWFRYNMFRSKSPSTFLVIVWFSPYPHHMHEWKDLKTHLFRNMKPFGTTAWITVRSTIYAHFIFCLATTWKLKFYSISSMLSELGRWVWKPCTRGTNCYMHVFLREVHILTSYEYHKLKLY